MASRKSRYQQLVLGSARRSSTPHKGTSRDAFEPQTHASTADSYSRRSVQDVCYDAEDSTQSPDSYTRRFTQNDYVKRRAKKLRRKKIVIGVMASVLVLALSAGVAAAAFLSSVNSRIQEDVDDDLLDQLTVVAEESDPFYVLLLGIDSSEERESSDAYEGDNFRSDSMILARIDPTEQQITLISIMRDTYVDMGEYGYQKINAAHALGGDSYAVEVVSEYAGVEISHYAEIDFDGFKAVVDALGGIEVDVPVTIDDDEAGGYVEAGLQTLDGDQALILCRSRHTYDDEGDGDTYRAANQRLVLGAIAEKLLSSDVATIASTIDAVADYITTDMSVDEIMNIALQLQGMDTDEDIYSCMNPTISVYENNLWVEYTNIEAWQTMMERVDAGLSPTVNEEASANRGGVTDGTLDKEYIAQSVLLDSGSGSGEASTVAVRNGNGISGLAARAASALTNSGFDVTETSDADSYDYANTMIIYDDSDQESVARDIGEVLGVGITVQNNGDYEFEGSFLVILGADYTG